MTVTVSVTDNLGLQQVTANGVLLTQGAPPYWTGQLRASTPCEVKTVAVTAADHAGNPANSSATYKVAPLAGTSCRSVTDPIMTSACGSYLFELWGKVTIIDFGSFWLDDGSTSIIRIIAPGYSGIGDGDYASARGILSPGPNPLLECRPEHVRKLD